MDASESKGGNNAYQTKEVAARKARTQWIPEGWDPKNPGYYDPLNCATLPEGGGHGLKLPTTDPHDPNGHGYHSEYDPSRGGVNTSPGAPANEDTVGKVGATGSPPSLKGPGSATKDWRAESSRIGRFYHNPNFQPGGNGTWKMANASANPFEIRPNRF